MNYRQLFRMTYSFRFAFLFVIFCSQWALGLSCLETLSGFAPKKPEVVKQIEEFIAELKMQDAYDVLAALNIPNQIEPRFLEYQERLVIERIRDRDRNGFDPDRIIRLSSNAEFEQKRLALRKKWWNDEGRKVFKEVFIKEVLRWVQEGRNTIQNKFALQIYDMLIKPTEISAEHKRSFITTQQMHKPTDFEDQRSTASEVLNQINDFFGEQGQEFQSDDLF